MYLQNCIKSKIFIPTLCGGQTEPVAGQVSIEDIDYFDWRAISRLTATPNNNIQKLMQSLLNKAAIKLKAVMPTLLRQGGISEKIDAVPKNIAVLSSMTNTAGLVGTERGVTVKIQDSGQCRRDVYTSIKLTTVRFFIATPFVTDFQIEFYEVTNGVRSLNYTQTITAGTSGEITLPDIVTKADAIQLVAPSEVITSNTVTNCPSCPHTSIECLTWNNINVNGTTVTEGIAAAAQATYGFTFKGVYGCDTDGILCNLIDSGIFTPLLMQYLSDAIVDNIMAGSILSEYTLKEPTKYHTEQSVKNIAAYQTAIIDYLKVHRNQLQTPDCFTCRQAWTPQPQY